MKRKASLTTESNQTTLSIDATKKTYAFNSTPPPKKSDITSVKNFPIYAFENARVTIFGKNEKVFYTGIVEYIDTCWLPRGFGTIVSNDGLRCLRAEWCRKKIAGYCKPPFFIPSGRCTLYESDGTQLEGNFESMPSAATHVSLQGDFFQYETATGKFIGKLHFENNLKEGPTSSMFPNGCKAEGKYVQDKRDGIWKFTNSDGSSYTTKFNNDVEDVSKRSTVTPAPTSSGAQDETECSEQRQRKEVVQRERVFTNDTVQKWRETLPNAKLATEHPVGSKRIDVFVENEGITAIGEFKASSKV